MVGRNLGGKVEFSLEDSLDVQVVSLLAGKKADVVDLTSGQGRGTPGLPGRFAAGESLVLFVLLLGIFGF